MKYKKLIIMTILIMFTACGDGNKENRVLDNKVHLNSKSLFTHAEKTVTIYVHGFKKDGYERNRVYGDEYISPFTTKLKTFTALPSIDTYDKDSFSNLVIGVEYYGNQSPSYYTQADIDEVAQSTDGIPKYALVVAKFTKHILEETNATRVNIVSISMGSLITRYMIEKNLENLAAEKKIEKWMTAEGVLRGNYALSMIDEIDSELIKNTINSFFNASPESNQMKYLWIEANLTPNREAMNSPYYSDILVGQISLTDSEKSGGVGLKYILHTHDGFQANDGYQLVKDTYFSKLNSTLQVPSHTLVHLDHVSINTSDSVFASIATFLEAKKRVRITLVDVTVNDIHEIIIPTLNNEAEIIFVNEITSTKANAKFSMTAPLAQRTYDSGTLPIYNFTEAGTKKLTNQILFDDFVLNSETKLQVAVEGYEIDRNLKYFTEELAIDSKDSLGNSTTNIDLVNGVYPVSSKDWSGHIKVEVVGM